MIFDSAGKYGAYSKCDDRTVVKSRFVEVALPSGGTQPYRFIDLKFAPLSYSQRPVERRALIIEDPKMVDEDLEDKTR